MNRFDYFHRQPIQPTSGVIVLSIPEYRADRAPGEIYQKAEADGPIHVISVFWRLLPELALNVTDFKLAIKESPIYQEG